MILTCPACGQSYFADDDSIGSDGRQVKCASCGHEWFARSENAEVGEAGLTRGAHERYLEAVRLRQRRRSRTVAIAAWIVTATLFVGAVTSAMIWRNDVVRIWPQSATAFAAIGLDVNRFGVEFENVERSRELRGTMPVLTVSADVRNVTRRAQPAPRVRVGLLDDFGREIAHIFADVTPATISAGDAGQFSAIIENPPVESFRLDLRFVTQTETGALRAESAPES